MQIAVFPYRYFDDSTCRMLRFHRNSLHISCKHPENGFFLVLNFIIKIIPKIIVKNAIKLANLRKKMYFCTVLIINTVQIQLLKYDNYEQYNYHLYDLPTRR